VTLWDEWLGLYPRLHLASNNMIFLSGPAKLGSMVDQNALASAIPGAPPLPAPQHERTWLTTVGRNPPGTLSWDFDRIDGASVFLSINGVDFVVRIGGQRHIPGVPPIPPTHQATNTAELCIASPGNIWIPLPQGAIVPGGPRAFLNAVVLPDASILVVGGQDTATDAHVMTTALYRPGIGWSVEDPSPSRRAYHSTAVLLPDARVFVGGGEIGTPLQTNEHDYDIFEPGYLKGNPLRPQINLITNLAGVPVPLDPQTGTADELVAGQQFIVTCTSIPPLDTLKKLVLIAPGSITHHSDMTARYVDVTGALVGSSSDMQFKVPADGSVPRGFYMMFALNSAGVPSIARWVKVV
jgi:hypothetical protein